MKTNESALLAQCHALVDSLGIHEDADMAAEMVQTVLRLAADSPGRADMKLMLRTVKELRYGFKTFKPYRSQRKVSMFGSARTAPENPDYIVAVDFAHRVANAGFMVITGAGGGIMQAGHEGAGQSQSFGVAIKLPFEQSTNAVIAGDAKLIHFRYFFTRKLMFVKETHAFALFPGGFGTHDESFEVLTLVQTGRADPMPIVLLERPGGDYWPAWDHFVRGQLLAKGLISHDDTALYHIARDAQDAVDHIRRFYFNYHSLRYVKTDLVLRIHQAPTPAELADLQRDFSDIAGHMAARPAAEVEPPDAIVPEFPRLVLDFNRRSLARLRMLIDRLNTLPSLPPPEAVAREPAQVGSDKPDRHLGHLAEEESIKLANPDALRTVTTPGSNGDPHANR